MQNYGILRHIRMSKSACDFFSTPPLKKSLFARKCLRPSETPRATSSAARQLTGIAKLLPLPLRTDSSAFGAGSEWPVVVSDGQHDIVSGITERQNDFHVL